MAHTRRFNGKIYHHDALLWSLVDVDIRAKELKQKGYSVRKTSGSTSLTHTPYWEIWKFRLI